MACLESRAAPLGLCERVSDQQGRRVVMTAKYKGKCRQQMGPPACNQNLGDLCAKLHSGYDQKQELSANGTVGSNLVVLQGLGGVDG